VIKVGIVGGTGYTGVELLRLLATHPHVEVVAILLAVKLAALWMTCFLI